MKIVFNPLTGMFDIASAGGGGGTGDVIGPSSSTDNAVVRWDGITGKLIQNSTAILNDDGVLSTLANMQQDTIPTAVTVTVAEREIYIIGEELDTDGTLDLEGTLIII
jgi:hypothetical protein